MLYMFRWLQLVTKGNQRLPFAWIWPKIVNSSTYKNCFKWQHLVTNDYHTHVVHRSQPNAASSRSNFTNGTTLNAPCVSTGIRPILSLTEADLKRSLLSSAVYDPSVRPRINASHAVHVQLDVHVVYIVGLVSIANLDESCLSTF